MIDTIVRTDGGRIDVIIVSYRSAETIGLAIASVRSDPLVKSVLVVDNNPGDGSAASAVAAGADRVVSAGRNVGYAKAVNSGMPLGNAPLILLLNPDAALEPGSLRLLAETLDDVRAVAAGPVLVAPDGSLIIGARRFSTTWNRLAGSLPGVRRLRGMSAEYPADLLLAGDASVMVDYLWGAAMVVRRDFFVAAGGFDERFFMYHEDEDLCYRARQEGYAVRLVPPARVRHVGGFSSRDRPGLAEARLSFATAQLLEKWRGPAQRRAFVTLRPLAFALDHAVAILRHDPRRAVAAREARITFGRILATRRHSQTGMPK